MDYLKIHSESVVLDSHCDTPIRLLDGADLSNSGSGGHVDFNRMEKGGVDASFFVLYTSNKMDPDAATRRALQMAARIYDTIEANKKRVDLALCTADIIKLKSKGKRAILIGMENGLPIQKDLSLLRIFYDLGVRYMTLTHAGNNDICDSCATKEKTWHGLSPFGIEVIKEMNRLGMLIDVSHISDEAFYDVLKYSEAPVVATHSCCRAISDHPRNLTDQMIIDLAAKGGVMQINFYPPFLNKKYADQFWPLCDAYEEAQEKYKKDSAQYELEFKEAESKMFALKRPSYKEVIDHIDHVVKLVGPKHVGLGSDFDGIETTPEGLEGIDKFSIITKELVERGYGEESIKGILGGNFLRILQ